MQRNEKDAATRSTGVEGRATSLSGIKWGNRRWLPVMFVQQEMGQVLACLWVFSACEVSGQAHYPSISCMAMICSATWISFCCRLMACRRIKVYACSSLQSFIFISKPLACSIRLRSASC